MTHPISLKDGSTAEMTSSQMKEYNVLAKKWTDLRKLPVKEESSIFDKVSNFFSSDETKEAEKTVPREATSEEFEDYLQKEFRNIDNIKVRNTKAPIKVH